MEHPRDDREPKRVRLNSASLTANNTKFLTVSIAAVGDKYFTIEVQQRCGKLYVPEKCVLCISAPAPSCSAWSATDGEVLEAHAEMGEHTLAFSGDVPRDTPKKIDVGGEMLHRTPLDVAIAGERVAISGEMRLRQTSTRDDANRPVTPDHERSPEPDNTSCATSVHKMSA